MKQKPINKKESLLITKHKEELKDKWKESVVLSLEDVKHLLKAFKVMDIKEGKKTLIFENVSKWGSFREVGNQYTSYTIAEKKLLDQEGIEVLK